MLVKIFIDECEIRGKDISVFLLVGYVVSFIFEVILVIKFFLVILNICFIFIMYFCVIWNIKFDEL